MKMVVLMGSPRKKDSYRVCKEIEECMKMENISFEYLYLKDYHVQDCKGCDQCFQKSESQCPCQDDLAVIREALLEADAIIIATPVYAYQVPAPLKRIIDRLSYWFHRQELVGKPVLLVVTTAGGGQREVSRYMKMTIAGWGCHLVASLSVIAPFYFKENQLVPAWGYKEAYHQKIRGRIEKASLDLLAALSSKSPRVPGYYELLLFNGLRTKTVTSNADYEFWREKGWLESNYFYPVRLGFCKTLFGYLVKGVINQIVRRSTDSTSSSF